ncbi:MULTISPECIES: efflux RND transporter periplasmic adaptor subunit [unclassified Colwellia]|jgi:HlyD family secretion protein|uniref:efflux RND transporter periplasmic adaptor subunit n=1 Tax=unclassified Colwellia TaxID=196834 RepID=UPI0015F73740|nr:MULTISPECIES: HlyD family efflux transporter periplasmic adaptor subunit [unclassified Colwellia]MBA6233205.1 HlyD family efflux transporter periplasmic adaptor subunit [Colwellia sp. MB02u-7]MBA6236295.1 HlyD family efflux transporter periplasmic adaptor subunit [Colwellia sp. MB02u-11]MBA6256002.1 HlyD family efflux transporter periplasmic adaptor subunit [Colwellia sp. MB3u-28]MBA6259171.1 HlyD family efflux transporter periplasmic adaptor subunit [Colwellia sp. MB3u-41]MBA6298305.1 HlyD
MDKRIINSPLQKYLKSSIYGMVIFAISIMAYSFTQSSAEGRSHNLAINTLTISPVTQGTFVDALSLRGQVVPKTTIYLDTTAGGRVEQRLVEQGEFVKKGQPLVRLSNTNLQLDVMGREAQVTEQLNFLRNTQMNMATSRLDLRRDLLEVELQISHLKRRVKQSSTLVNKGLLAKDRLAEVADNLSYYKARKVLTIERQEQENSIRKVQVRQLEESAIMLEKNLQFARKNLDNLLIKAPVSGYLSEFNVELGESKERSARLGQIDIPNEYKLVIKLDEFYLNQVQKNLTVMVELEAGNIMAKVSKIDSRVNQSQFQIEVDLPTNAGDIKRGQNINIELMLGDDKEQALLLKRGAFFSNSGGNWAYVLNKEGNKAIRRTISLGKKNQQYFEVLSGLSLGEKVVTSSYGSFDKAQQLQLN